MTFAARVIVPIVEGPGDEVAAPVLLRRVLGERLGRYDLEVKRPKKAKGRGRLVKRLESFLEYARRTPRCAAILVLLDADKDCPKELGARLACRALTTGVGIPIAVVCAKPEYENWFLASDEGFPGDVEGFRGAKEWLSHKMPSGLAYKETKDQAALSSAIDIEAAFQGSRSFRRLCSALEELVACIDTNKMSVTPAQWRACQSG